MKKYKEVQTDIDWKGVGLYAVIAGCTMLALGVIALIYVHFVA